jgi:hypothetical protein
MTIKNSVIFNRGGRPKSRSRSRSISSPASLPERPTSAQIRNFNDAQLRMTVVHFLHRQPGTFLSGNAGDFARTMWKRRLIEHLNSIN